MAVIPDGANVGQPKNSTNLVFTFEVTNTGGVSGTWTLACSRTGGVTCVSVSQASVTLGPDQSANIDVTYNLGTTNGVLTLTASGPGGGDTGSINVTALTVGAPTAVVLRNHNGDNVDRSACLTVGAGPAGAWECGDLFVSHSMPGYSTMGRERSLSLLYNSAQAAPNPAIAVAITEGATLFTPTTVFAQLSVNTGGGYVIRDSASYTPWAGGTAPTRQLALTYSATSDSSGLYPFQITIQNRYNGLGTYSTTVSDTLVVVNRAQSRYGTGWSLGGVEQLVFNQPVGTAAGDILWIGGDASARRYRKLDATHWQAAAGAFRETLVYNAGPQTYTRTLRHGVVVTYDAAGRHIKTTGRTGQSTLFTWAADTLKTVRVPPNGRSTTTYTVAYASGKLDKITDPAGRILDVTVNGSYRLTSIVDPDTSVATQFGYDATGRMTSRTTRRGYVTSYTYGNSLRLTKAIVQRLAAVWDTTVFQPWDEKGLAVGMAGQNAIDTATAYTRVLGPRVNIADDASFWVDRWGAPVKIVNPLGQTTTIVRSDPTVPALITKVIATDGRVDSLTYNGRGNLTQLRDSTKHLDGQPTAVTQWNYGSTNTDDAPSSIVDPMGVRDSFAYNQWGLDSIVTAPNGHITRFEYKPLGSPDSLQGLVRAVTEFSVPAWSNATKTEPATTLVTKFGFNALGNVVADTSPMGRIRTYTRDSRQLVTYAEDPAEYGTTFTYDNANRMTRRMIDRSLAGGVPGFPSDSGVTQPDTTKWTFTLGDLTQVRDPRGVTRSFTFDGLDRPLTETDDWAGVEKTWYNAAGLVDSTLSRVGRTVRNSYDQGGRLSKTTWEARDSTPADSVIYTYDSGNRILTAQRFNSPGQTITRTYYGNGALKSETQTGGQTTHHTYGYNKAGQRTWYVIGQSTTRDSITYRYDATTGLLASMWVQWRNLSDQNNQDSVRFAWDALGRRDTVAFPAIDATIRYAYDADGVLRVACSLHPPGASGGGTDYLKFSVYHDSLDLLGRTVRTSNAGGLTICGLSGQAVAQEQNTFGVRGDLLTQTTGAGALIRRYRYDGSGNMLWSQEDDGTVRERTYTVGAGHNRMTYESPGGTPGSPVSYSYYNDGSRKEECPWSTCSDTMLGYRKYLYDGLGRVSGTLETGCLTWDPSSNGCLNGQWDSYRAYTCRYDPLGRMSLPCENGGPILGYDGETVTRTDGDAAISGWTFVHGPGLDDPLLGYQALNKIHAYYLTDGGGRQYGVADRGGATLIGTTTQAQGAYQYAGKYAGGTQQSTSFAAERQQSKSQPGLSFFRNRFYDQATGRWTQEDPIGIAGGSNLYEYVGNNPSMFTDPFGLCEKKGNCTQSDVGPSESQPKATTYVGAGFTLGYIQAVGFSAGMATDGKDQGFFGSFSMGAGLGMSGGVFVQTVKGPLASGDSRDNPDPGGFRSDQPTTVSGGTGLVQPTVTFPAKGQNGTGAGAGVSIGPGVGLFVTQSQTAIFGVQPIINPSYECAKVGTGCRNH